MFQNRVVIVTGAGNGIGRAVAKGYAKEGAMAVIAEVDQKSGQEVEEEIRAEGGQALFIPTDVRDPQQIVRLMSNVYEKFGDIHILINNAGVSRWKSPYDLTVDEWDDIININLRGQFLCAREAAKYMRNHNQLKAIVNIASTRAFMSEPDSEGYAASKGGIIALTYALAVSFSKNRIRVNAISPGWIETRNYSQLSSSDHEQHPAGRVGTPQDIVRTCFFLTNPENDFITGENIVVDGGMTKKMIYEE